MNEIIQHRKLRNRLAQRRSKLTAAIRKDIGVLPAAQEAVREFWHAREQFTEIGYPSSWSEWEMIRQDAEAQLRDLGVAA